MQAGYSEHLFFNAVGLFRRVPDQSQAYVRQWREDRQSQVYHGGSSRRSVQTNATSGSDLHRSSAAVQKNATDRTRLFHKPLTGWKHVQVDQSELKTEDIDQPES